MMSCTLSMSTEGTGQRITTGIITLLTGTTVTLFRRVDDPVSTFTQLGDLQKFLISSKKYLKRLVEETMNLSCLPDPVHPSHRAFRELPSEWSTAHPEYYNLFPVFLPRMLVHYTVCTHITLAARSIMLQSEKMSDRLGCQLSRPLSRERIRSLKMEMPNNSAVSRKIRRDMLIGAI